MSQIKQIDESFLDSLLEGVVPVTAEENKEGEQIPLNVPVTKLENIPTLTDETELEIEELEPDKPSNNGSTPNSNDNSLKSLFEAQIEFYKKNGSLPEDFELEDGVELDEETFGEVLQYSKEYLQEQLSNNVREQYTSKLGSDIIEFLENGGDYNTFAELVKEQNKIQDYNLDTLEGQKAIVKKYYTEVLNYSEQRADSKIDKLVNYGDIEEEAIESKSQFDKHYQQIQKELVIKQQEAKQQQEAFRQKQITDFQTSLQQKGLSQQTVDSYVDFVYKDAYRLQDGTTLPALDVKILQLQRNPEELSELVMFLTNKDEYLKKKAVEINNPKVDKTFKSIVKGKLIGSSSTEPVKNTNKFQLTFK